MPGGDVVRVGGQRDTPGTGLPVERQARGSATGQQAGRFLITSEYRHAW